MKITGKTRVGSTLSASTSKWGPATVGLSYTWYRDGKAIKGATKKTYKLVSADAGKPVKLKVTGKKTGYTTASKSSASTVKIKR